MEKLMILNGSPRAPRSNSKEYAAIFTGACSLPTEIFAITPKNHLELCSRMEGFSQLLLVFPLYADGIPVPLLSFLKTLAAHPPKKKPVISVLINCGFIEWQQNRLAVEMVKLFCTQQGYVFGSALMIGSGEAILKTPFRFLAERGIRKLAASIQRHQYRTFHTTMPLPKKLFIRASTNYWLAMGEKKWCFQGADGNHENRIARKKGTVNAVPFVILPARPGTVLPASAGGIFPEGLQFSASSETCDAGRWPPDPASGQ